MRLGVFDPIFSALEFEPMLDHVVELGLTAIELGTGNYPRDRHCRPADLLANAAARATFQHAITERGLIISALSCQGNPIHPNVERAAHDDGVFRDTVLLAELIGVDVVNVFSGNPGDGPDASQPNWVTCTWPPEYAAILRWQWERVAIPYWSRAGRFASDHGVRLAFEMHPGMLVYNPRTLLHLRAEIGDVIGANMDPSHLFWQGIDPLLAIEDLGAAIVHVDAKDTSMDPFRVARHGVLDMPPGDGPRDRPWSFRSVGDGHDLLFWKRFVSALRVVGYDHVISIEHEDRLASADEGIQRAIATLRSAILTEAATATW